MATYDESWASMSEDEQDKMSEMIGQMLTALIDHKHNIRLNDDFKHWAAEAMSHTITKNHATIHYFFEHCKQQEVHPFEALGMCLSNYKASIEKGMQRQKELENVKV